MIGHAQCRRGGFTLLELLVVITILGLVTATVTTRIADTLGPAAMKQSVSQLEFTDQWLRRTARHTGKPATLYIQIAANCLGCAVDDDQGIPRTIRALGHGVQISRFVSATQDVAHGPARVAYDDRGVSESFAIEFRGRRDARQWLIVAGLTGQITEISDEASAREIIQKLLPAGLHSG